MNTQHGRKTILILTLFTLLTSCSSPSSQPAIVSPSQRASNSTDVPQANMANPASVYCEEQGNKLEIRTAADGSQSGLCIFPDGSECDEWAYFRGECGPAGQGESASATTSPFPDAARSFLVEYKFPTTIDLAEHYMIYLHGKIIEDQGIPAISPDFGEYEYEAILERLRGYDFVVISEQRPKDTDGVEYAGKIAQQVTELLDAGVPAKNIIVVGASKGAGIAIYVSHFLENVEINYVLLAICHPDEVAYLEQNQINLYGNVLSIYDSVDEFAGSCQELFAFSEGKGISRHEEIVLSIGTGHGVLFQPLDQWIIPTVQWAGQL
jgi:putative hemolysin